MTARVVIRLGAGAALTTSLLLTAEVQAQAPDINPNLPVTERPRPAFDPLNIRVGSFLLAPRNSLGVTYNSNVFFEDDDEESDFLFTLNPAISARSDWSVHELNLNAGAEIGFYTDFDDENYQDAFIGADGRFDISRRMNLRGGLSYAREHDGRGTIDALDVDAAAEPTIFDILRGELSFTQRFNRLGYRLRGVVAQRNFDDVDAVGGGTINNDDRDRLSYNGGVRVFYDYSPLLDVFVDGRYTVTDFDDDEDDAGFNRDSDGFEISAGVDYELTSILFGEAFVGFRQVDFDDDAFDEVTGFSFGAEGIWNPTRLTSVTLGARRDIVPTTSTTDAAGNLKTTLDLDVDHELRRNVLLNGGITYIRDSLDDGDRIDNTFAPGVGVSYLLNRNLSFGANYRFEHRSSDEDNNDFTANIVTLTVTGRL